MEWSRIERVARASLASLGPAAEGAVLYLDRRPWMAGDLVQIDGRGRAMPFSGAVAFIDLEPTANWGHACRYLLLPDDGGEPLVIEARMPPFLRGAPATLEVLHQGGGVPDWAVKRPRPIRE